MSRLVKGMTGEKGVGAQIIKGIGATGLLLIDEANSTMPPEIKDLDKEIHIDQFGANGTHVLPLLFTILTSTHKAATRNNSDELYNRFLQVELTENEMRHNVTDGPMFRKDSLRYTDVITSYLRTLFKETIESDATIEDLDEFVFEASVKIIESIKANSRDDGGGDYLRRGDVYYAKRKRDVHDLAKEYVSELPGIDHEKYAEKLTSHFVGDHKSIKLDGKPVKYYVLNLRPYSLDLEQQIANEFDDLDDL